MRFQPLRKTSVTTTQGSGWLAIDQHFQELLTKGRNKRLNLLGLGFTNRFPKPLTTDFRTRSREDRSAWKHDWNPDHGLLAAFAASSFYDNMAVKSVT